MAKSSKHDKKDNPPLGGDVLANAVGLLNLSPSDLADLQKQVGLWSKDRMALEASIYESELLSYALLGHLIKTMPNTKEGNALRLRAIDQRRKVSELLLTIEPDDPSNPSNTAPTGANRNAKGKPKGSTFLAAAAGAGSVKSGRGSK